MGELKRYQADIYGDDSADVDVYLCSEVDALLAERDRRERMLEAELETQKRWKREEHESFLCAAEKLRKAQSDLAALRQQVREVTEWRPMETAPRDGTEIEAAYGFDDIWSSEFLSWRDGGWYWGESDVTIEEGHMKGWRPRLPLPPLPKEVERE